MFLAPEGGRAPLDVTKDWELVEFPRVAEAVRIHARTNSSRMNSSTFRLWSSSFASPFPNGQKHNFNLCKGQAAVVARKQLSLIRTQGGRVDGFSNLAGFNLDPVERRTRSCCIDRFDTVSDRRGFLWLRLGVSLPSPASHALAPKRHRHARFLKRPARASVTTWPCGQPH